MKSLVLCFGQNTVRMKQFTICNSPYKQPCFRVSGLSVCRFKCNALLQTNPLSSAGYANARMASNFHGNSVREPGGDMAARVNKTVRRVIVFESDPEEESTPQQLLETRTQDDVSVSCSFYSWAIPGNWRQLTCFFAC